jgi:hypothetical protein
MGWLKARRGAALVNKGDFDTGRIAAGTIPDKIPDTHPFVRRKGWVSGNRRFRRIIKMGVR